MRALTIIATVWVMVVMTLLITPSTTSAISSSNEGSSDSRPPLERQPARVGAWKEIDLNVNGKLVNDQMTSAN
jgi:hypothetical protein